jgi:hypothetical protein
VRNVPANARANVAADASPEQTTANATRKVTNGLPKALFT